MPSAPDSPEPPRRGRSFHRVAYPAPDRPRLVLADGATGRVLDCSERGVRYLPDPGPRPPTFGTLVEGRVEFRAAPPAPITGRAIRVADGAVALHLALPGIPLRTLFDEQRALRARYPFAGGEPPPARD